MDQNITLLDGAIGTALWETAEANGVKKEPVWKYNVEHPAFVEELTRQYLDAGSGIVLSNTFSANGPSVTRSSPYSVDEVITAGVAAAKRALAGTDGKLALSIGPLTELLEPYGDLEEEECAAIYDEMLRSGVGAGCDLILFETFMDLAMMRVAVGAARAYGLPVFCSMTFEKSGKTMFGNSVGDVIETLAPLGISAIGLNCSLGPGPALPVIREFAEKTDLPLLFKPNAGKPVLKADGTTAAAYSAEQFADEIRPALPYVRYLGGCCGTGPDYIRALKEMI